MISPLSYGQTDSKRFGITKKVAPGGLFVTLYLTPVKALWVLSFCVKFDACNGV